jgi:predicted kinase
VTLIAGPPCSGKTTLARQLARPGDVVLDLDTIAIRLGSPRRWQHSPEYVAQAEAHMHAALRRLATIQTAAYVVRSLPHPRQRAQLARALHATVLVLNPGQAECIRRARADRRPRDTESAIRWWYRTYRPHPLDTPWPPSPASTAAH